MKTLHRFDPVFDSQYAFRLLLEAMANPVRRVDFAAPASRFDSEAAPLLAVGMTLLDHETPFHTYGDEALGQLLSTLTLAQPCAPEAADYLFVPRGADSAAAAFTAKPGTLSDPHLGATVVVLDSGAESHSIRVRGPGVNGAADTAVSEAALEALRARDRQAAAYPLGIDLIFVSAAGALYALPRTARWEER